MDGAFDDLGELQADRGQAIGYRSHDLSELLLGQDAAAQVYATVAGFELDTQETVAGEPYTVFRRDGKPRAGLLVDPFPEVTPLWLPYVRVADPAQVVAKVEGLGGQVLLKPDSRHREGTVAIIADPMMPNACSMPCICRTFTKASSVVIFCLLIVQFLL